MAQIHQIIENMLTSSDAPIAESIKVVTNAAEVSNVYCRGAHLLEECSGNSIYVNYEGNQKYNNPYNNTYNPGWQNHLNFSCNNNQNHLKRQTPPIPPSFYASNPIVATHGNN